MAKELKLAEASANAQADATCALLNGGKLRIYDGTKPATANTDVSTQNLLAELTFGNPAFASASGGIATAEDLTSDADADGGASPAAWFRALKSDDTPVFDGTVGTADCDLNLATTTIVAGAEVQVTSMTFTQPKA